MRPATTLLLVSTGLLIVGTNLLAITLPLQLVARATPTTVVGLVMACFYAGMVVGTRTSPRVVGAVGHVRAFAGFAAILSAIVVAHPLLDHPLPWAGLRFLAGWSVAALLTTIESWLNEAATNETRGAVLGTYTIVFYLATGAGLLLINGFGAGGIRVFLGASVFVSLSLVPVVLTRVREPDLTGMEPLPLRELYRSSPSAVTGAAGAGLITGAFYGLGALFGRSVGLSALGASLFMGLAVLGGLVSQWPLGYLSDAFDRRKVLLALLALSALVAAGGASLRVAGWPNGALLGVAVLHGVVVASVYPMSIAQAFDRLPRARMVAAASGLLLAYAVGATLGPILGAVTMSLVGPQGYFVFSGVATLALAAHLAWRMVRRSAPPPAEQAPFILVRPTSPAQAELDPRGEPGSEAV